MALEASQQLTTEQRGRQLLVLLAVAAAVVAFTTMEPLITAVPEEMAATALNGTCPTGPAVAAVQTGTI